MPCIGDLVVLTCYIYEREALQWSVEGTNSTITFKAKDEPGTIKNISNLFANLTMTNQKGENYQNIGNMTSELTVIANESNIGKHVYCSDGQLPRESTTINHSGILI